MDEELMHSFKRNYSHWLVPKKICTLLLSIDGDMTCWAYCNGSSLLASINYEFPCFGEFSNKTKLKNLFIKIKKNVFMVKIWGVNETMINMIDMTNKLVLFHILKIVTAT